jgi:hypothetical protein
MKLHLMSCVLLLAACGSDTTGKRITLHTTVTAAPDKAQLTTGFGWDVTLTKAAIATEGFYYFDGPPPTARYRPKPKRWSDYLVGTAHAHPGHYQSGTALGEALFPGPETLDLFAPAPILLPDGGGITGTYRSARVLLPNVEGHIAVAEGKAALHGSTSPTPIYFRLVADYNDVSTSIQNGAVDGCVLDEVDVGENGAINMQIEPRVWLNLVDFSKIAPGTAEAPTEARDAGFSQGITQLSAYRFTYSK